MSNEGSPAMQRDEQENGLVDDSQSESEVADELEYDDEPEPDFDWAVFAIRASGFVVLGAILVTSVDLSFNQAFDWLTIMRGAILPFVGGMLLLAAAELIDRRGD